MSLRLPVEEILRHDPAHAAEEIGRSRQGRPVLAARIGSGSAAFSLVGGCHADEPVGPAMLERLAAYLQSLPDSDPLLAAATWSLVPHVNPDGDAVNAAWSADVLADFDPDRRPDLGFDLLDYASRVVREAPGDDVEFGFPRDAADRGARPENRAVADFLRRGAPYHLHGSLHGMAFAPGPWFLIGRAWIARTGKLRARLRRRVAEMGYSLLDWDRRGDKGFERIDEGFSTRPDSAAMRRHFEALDDPGTAALFRPSSMELVRSLGGDPFTFVSEMPLFLHPDPEILSRRRAEFRLWLESVVALGGDGRSRLSEAGIGPMPLADQMRLQLAFVQEAIDAALGAVRS